MHSLAKIVCLKVHVSIRRRSALDLSYGGRQGLQQEIGQLGEGGSMSPLSTRRWGIDDDMLACQKYMLACQVFDQTFH